MTTSVNTLAIYCVCPSVGRVCGRGEIAKHPQIRTYCPALINNWNVIDIPAKYCLNQLTHSNLPEVPLMPSNLSHDLAKNSNRDGQAQTPKGKLNLCTQDTFLVKKLQSPNETLYG